MCVCYGYIKVSAYDVVVEDEPFIVDKYIGVLNTKGICPDTMYIYVEESNECSAFCYIYFL